MESSMLAGLTVLDLTQYLAGPTVTRLLAEMGADVIKIEAAPTGDPTRFMPFRVDDRSAYFIQQNLGKRSLCVDLTSARGVEVVRSLAARADLVVENYGPGVLARKGLDYENLREVNPGVVMCSITAFGRGNSFSDLTGFDYIAQGFAGIMDVTGEPDGPPQPVGVAIADGVSGVTAFGAIGYALWHRERTGLGQHIDISMVDSLYHLQAYTVQQLTASGGEYIPQRVGTRHPDAPTVGVFNGPTGPLILFVMERQWRALCTAMGMPELADDERFSKPRARLGNRQAFEALFEEWLARFDTNEDALEVLAAHRVPSGPVLTIAQTVEHPYFTERGMIREINDPVLGRFKIPGFPLNYSAFPDRLELEAPTLGAHNIEVLREFGFTDEDIADLGNAGVLGGGPG